MTPASHSSTSHFITDNGLIYTCGESRHNKLCLEEADDAGNSNEAVPNQYTPKRVTAMNSYIVDNVACGGCHTLLTATKSQNDDLLITQPEQEEYKTSLMELPPLQNVPGHNKTEGIAMNDAANLNNNKHPADNINGNSQEETGSIDSLEANVSGSHIVNINELDENGSALDVPNVNKQKDTTCTIPDAEMDLNDAIVETEKTIERSKEEIKDVVHNLKEEVVVKMEVVEDIILKTDANLVPLTPDEKISLEIPDKTAEIANSPPPKSPIIQDLLHIPDLSQMSPVPSKHSDDGTGQSENETIPCASDKSSPQAEKTAKTQAVMPIVRSEDHIGSEMSNCEDTDVVVNKMAEKGRFARIFQSIRDKESSCMGKGKVIEEKVVGKYIIFCR